MVEAAAVALGAPSAALSVCGDDSPYVVASYGALSSGDELARRLAFTALMLGEEQTVSAEDVAAQEPSALRAACLGAGIGSYLGVLLPGGGAYRFGMLCVFDRRARIYETSHVHTLRTLAKVAFEQLAISLALDEANAVRHELSTLVDASPVAIATFDLEGRVRTWSPASERLYGWRASEVVGRFAPMIAGGHNSRDFKELLAAVRRGASVLSESTRRLRADGSQVDVCVSAAPLFGADGAVTGFISLTQDVHELDRAQRRIRLLESVVLTSNESVAITKASPESPDIVYVNAAFTRMFGYAAEEIVGCSLRVLRSPEHDAEALERVIEARRACRPITVESVRRRKDGEEFWCESSLSPIVEGDGICENWLIVSRDISARRAAEQWQRHRAEVLELIAADAPLADILAALVATAESARPGAGAIVMLRDGDVLRHAASGSALTLAVDRDDLPIAVGDSSEPCGVAAADGVQVVFAQSGRRAEAGTYYDAFAADHAIKSSWSTPIRVRAGPIVGTFTLHSLGDAPPSTSDLRLGSEFAHLAGIAMERRSAREQLEFLALHDSLTTLPNRVLFEQRLESSIAAARETGTTVGVGMLDLNRFKVINDNLGHASGDRLLREVALRLRSCARAEDVVARLGGDEFVVLMTGLRTREEAAEVAGRMLQALAPSFECAGQEVFVRASVGIACYPADASDAPSLLALCDEAMYGAKAQGGGVVFHDRGEKRHGVARIALESSLNRALENGEFEIVFQPQVDLRTRELRGVEALLRWNHPTLGEILPDVFIRIAEDTGLIVPIGAWVLEEACRFALQWQSDGFERYVAVNVSARQFDRHEFVETVTRALEITGLEPGRLHLELTETMIMRSPETAAATLARLKALGVSIVIDDFGTGYSSFNYLKRFPLDALKIDRLFVRDVGFGNPASGDEAIVRAIVGVARALDLKIVAEGVENEDQVTFLRAIGVHLAQGFLFARPLRPAEALRWPRKPATLAR